MPILVQDGRPRSVRTRAEDERVVADDLARLSPEEREAYLEIVGRAGAGDLDAHISVASVEYAEAPVDVRTFLNDPYFLGETGGSLWPRLVEDMVELFEGGYHEAAFAGSLGWGKSFLATTALSYVLYQMSCLRDPQRAYGIAPGSALYIVMLSVTEKVARRVSVNEMIAKISHSRYFKERFPWDAAPSALEIRFPRGIQVIAGSTGSSAIIGLNAFAGFVDEVNFMGAAREVDRTGKIVGVDKGEAIYKSIVRRMKSRFQRSGRLPGLMILASSKESPYSFVERRIQQAVEQGDPSFFVRDYPTWAVKPSEQFTGKFFKVAAGNDKTHSRILAGADEEARLRELGCQIVEVPEEYRPDFERDLEGSLRDIAGVASQIVSPYIQRTEKIYEAMDPTLPNPIGGEDAGDAIGEVTAGEPFAIHWGRIAVSYERRLPGGYTEVAWRPRRNPSAPRYVHIDPSLTGDCTGVVIAHVSGWTEVVRRDAMGEEYNELAPVIETDLILRVNPTPGDEILLSDVRTVVYQFQEHGFHIAFGSMDQFQSADGLQQFRKRGIEAEVVSMDRTTEAYDVVKAALYESRLRLHNHPLLGRELRNLQRVPRPGGNRGFKIDHPKTSADGTPGSKDVADALAGVVFSLTQRAPGLPMMPQRGLTDAAQAEQADHSWVTDGKVVVQVAETGRRGQQGSIVGTSPGRPDLPMPFIKG